MSPKDITYCQLNKKKQKKVNSKVMKKILVALLLSLSAVAVATTDVYAFSSTMKTYSLRKQGYVTTTLKGTLTIDSTTGEATLDALKRDTNERFVMTSEDWMGIVSGKKNRVGAMYFDLSTTNDTMSICLAANGKTKTKETSCGLCGPAETCTKIKTLSGRMVGIYDCGCSNSQHYDYTAECENLDERETSHSPFYGSWKAYLKTVDGERYK